MEETQYIMEEIRVLETAIDDMNPEFFPYVIDKLLAEGALDAYLQPVIMKKGRPGIMLTVLTGNDEADLRRLLAVIMKETTTLGVRMRTEKRFRLHRGFSTVQTPYGPVRVKAAFTTGGGQPDRYIPEFEDCRALAAENNIPLREVYNAALLEANRGDEQW